MRARSTAAPRSLAATHRQVDSLGPDVTALQVVPVDELPPGHLVPKLVMQHHRSDQIWAAVQSSGAGGRVAA